MVFRVIYVASYIGILNVGYVARQPSINVLYWEKPEMENENLVLADRACCVLPGPKSV